ncbi:hypothetical protein SNOG_14389 [Parastagonospora nodorum SN15]|uniref:Uncharacterized protein n=1 Tax=Phaeosphaeria nodorum (strain SN15 / ATCC MYA-4574 / FGSC 10173) TaxID=321614 RepID=Q0U1K0_PHANO|nr:hypothetical protein SNOG_14389 [Parastagonospora nodorum SN15]EAT78260.1 hypothetical protein SNOG_14389 [Parastagonospora nodorum SN15]
MTSRWRRCTRRATRDNHEFFMRNFDSQTLSVGLWKRIKAGP